MGRVPSPARLALLRARRPWETNSARTRRCLGYMLQRGAPAVGGALCIGGRLEPRLWSRDSSTARAFTGAWIWSSRRGSVAGSSRPGKGACESACRRPGGPPWKGPGHGRGRARRCPGLSGNCSGNLHRHDVAFALPWRFRGLSGSSGFSGLRRRHDGEVPPQALSRRHRWRTGRAHLCSLCCGPSDRWRADPALWRPDGLHNGRGADCGLRRCLCHAEPRQRTSGVEMRLGILLRDAANDWRSLLQDPRQQALFGCNLALSLNYAALVTIMPLQAFHTFGTTAAEIGGLFSIGSATGIFLAPVAGALSDRWGRAPLLAPSLAVCAAGCFGVAFSQQWELFVLSNLLWSVGEAVLGPVLSAYAADIAPKEKVGSALSLGRQAGDLVFFLAPPVLGFIYDKWPDQGAMMLPAVLTLVCAAAVRHRLK
ncbi:norA [Symbiodinium necroappetens]|uniref:NorA protein n=1 Tax=Symbiodinium necroappetens TaxID=1628268 RepID=A0A812W1F3_9DINO|nr:norA [Symbiodinium necroappetens]